MQKPGLTPKQAAFVAEFLIDRNATQAAIRAGYSRKTANEQGARLLANVSVRAAIDSVQNDLAHRAGITAEQVMRERRRIALFDPRRLFNAEGSPIPIQDLDDDVVAAIAGIEIVQMGTDKETGVACMVKKYRLAAKDSSLTALERFFGTNEKPVRFALPEITDAASCAKAQSAVLRAVASGEIPPSEGQTMSTLIENQRRAFETTEVAERLEKIEELLGKKGSVQ